MSGHSLNLSMDEPVVHIIDSDSSSRASLCSTFQSVGKRAAEYCSAEEFLGHDRIIEAGCIISEIRLPGLGGLKLQEKLREKCCVLPMIFLTECDEISVAVRALKGGAIDYVQKPYKDQSILDLAHGALETNRELLLKRQELKAVTVAFDTLTPREKDTMKYVVEGKRNREIASECNISCKTVEAHRSQMMHKLGANSVAELTRMGMLVF